MSDLGENQDGRPIVSMGVIIRGTGDGLSKAMQTAPERISQGDEGYIILEWKCVDVHEPVEDRKYPALGGVRRVHVLDAGTATFADTDAVRKLIEQQKVKNRKLADEEAGRRTIDDAILIAQHEDGLHKRPVEGCEKCDAEREAKALAAEEAKATNNVVDL
jgi:hypothetical protein